MITLITLANIGMSLLIEILLLHVALRDNALFLSIGPTLSIITSILLLIR